MADISVHCNQERKTAWVIAESKQGERFMRKNFDGLSAYISLIEMEELVRQLIDHEDLAVEVY